MRIVIRRHRHRCRRFDGGRISSEAGLLLGATNQVIGLTRRLAACFRDARRPDLSEHDVETLVLQRIAAF